LSLGALQISIARKWLPLAQNCMYVCQCIVNAVPSETSNPLLMLPYMDNNLIRHCKTSKRHIKSISDFLEMGDESRKSLLRSLTEEQQVLMVLMAKQVPKVEVIGVKFQVLGQPEVTPEGFVCAQVKLRLTNHENIISSDSQKENLSTKPEVEDEVIDSDEGMEFDEDGNLVDICKKSKILVDKRGNPNDPVHAPYYPVEKKPFWWVVICNRVGTSFVTIPLKVSELAMNTSKTVTLQFEAPPKAGTVPLKIIVRSDALLGADIETDCELKVVADSKKEKVTWDISGEEDNDEDGSPDSD
jgi:translocation protein SEC63